MPLTTWHRGGSYVITGFVRVKWPVAWVKGGDTCKSGQDRWLVECGNRRRMVH